AARPRARARRSPRAKDRRSTPSAGGDRRRFGMATWWTSTAWKEGRRERGERGEGRAGDGERGKCGERAGSWASAPGRREADGARGGPARPREERAPRERMEREVGRNGRESLRARTPKRGSGPGVTAPNGRARRARDARQYGDTSRLLLASRCNPHVRV